MSELCGGPGAGECCTPALNLLGDIARSAQTSAVYRQRMLSSRQRERWRTDFNSGRSPDNPTSTRNRQMYSSADDFAAAMARATERVLGRHDERIADLAERTQDVRAKCPLLLVRLTGLVADMPYVAETECASGKRIEALQAEFDEVGL